MSVFIVLSISSNSGKKIINLSAKSYRFVRIVRYKTI